MADNVVLPGTGSSVATDDVGGVQFQKVKVNLGASGVDGGEVTPDNPFHVSDAAVADLIDGLQTLMIRLLNATNSPRGYDTATGRNRVTATVESGNIQTVATVALVSDHQQIGAQQARLLIVNQNTAAWAATVRARIS